jgi:hypothetical protein
LLLYLIRLFLVPTATALAQRHAKKPAAALLLYRGNLAQ